jgi:AcrR family transcriptional regulator
MAQDARDAQPRTQAERTAISDKAMVDAAIELILEHGTDKTTLAAIGEKAGYSRGLATYRFGSKAGLFDEVCKSISRHWLDYLKADVGDKIGIDAMCAALDSFFQFVSDYPREARVNPQSIDFRKANDDMKVHLKISLSPKAENA